MMALKDENEPERLAFAVKPMPEEAFDSWIRRIALRHQIGMSGLFRHLGCDPELARFDLVRGRPGLPAKLRIALDKLITQLGWAVGLGYEATPPPSDEVQLKLRAVSAIETIFVGCGRDDLLPPFCRTFGCAQCWLDWLTCDAPWRVERGWLLRVALRCERHDLLLTDLSAVANAGRTRAAERLLEDMVNQTRDQMARFVFIKTRIAWNMAISRAQIRGIRLSPSAYSSRYLEALIGNRFHFAPTRHLLLAALHSNDVAEAERMERLFGFARASVRPAPFHKPLGTAPRLSELPEAIAIMGLRQLARKRARLAEVALRLEQAWQNFPSIYANQLRHRQRAALAREVRNRHAVELAASRRSPVSALRGFQDAYFYLKECGFADDDLPRAPGSSDSWSTSGVEWLDDTERMREWLSKRFADGLFQTVLALPDQTYARASLERARRRSISAIAVSNAAKLSLESAIGSSVGEG